MTAHTPAPKASGVSALLASLSTVPPPPQPSVKQDFLAVMLRALLEGPEASSEHPAATQINPPLKPSPTMTAPQPASAAPLLDLLPPAMPKAPSHKPSVAEAASTPAAQTAPEKSSAPEAVPDLAAVSLLMALLAPPLITLNLTKPLSHKATGAPGPIVLSVPPRPAAPTQSAGETKPDKTDAAVKLSPVLTQALATKEPANAIPPTSGTSAANPSPRVSILSERNEIAGGTEQKVPPTAISAVSSADTGSSSPDGGGKSSLTFSWHEAPAQPLAIIELSAAAAVAPAPVANATLEAPVRVSSAAPLERLEQMISREAISVRQVGAESLGVTLKLDSNTQLFLQMTTHNGLVQASVRCERGNFAPEDTQWAQLQQSLARQNIELLPMTGGSNLNFQQPSEHRSRQQAAREEGQGAGHAMPPPQLQPQPRQEQKGQNRSRKNWETWA